MATYDYPRYSYTSTTPYKRVITDVISLIDPSDAPFINAIGGLDGASSKFRFVNGKVHSHRVARRHPGCCHH